jgi:MFS family permease
MATEHGPARRDVRVEGRFLGAIVAGVAWRALEKRGANREEVRAYALARTGSKKFRRRIAPLLRRRHLPAPMDLSATIFRHPGFARFCGARFLSSLAIQSQSVTIGWLVYVVARATHSVPESAFIVGMVGLSIFLPLFAFTLPGGATADRHDRRLVAFACMCVAMANAAVLAFLALHPQPSLVPLFALAGLFGATRAFLSPSTSAIGPMLVPRDELPLAVPWSAMANQSAGVIGPLVAGLLIAVSPALAFAASGAAFFGAGLLLVSIDRPLKPDALPGSRLAQIREGLAFVWSNRIVFGAISLDLFAVLLGGATALLPVFARDVLHVGASGFGMMRAGPAVGAVLVGLALSRWPLQRRAGAWMFAGVAVFGLATIVFAVSRWLPLSVLALAVLGGGDMLSVYVRQSMIQIVTPDAMRGRVTAVSFLFIGASNELGEFETGVVARLLGPVMAAVFGGVGCLVITAAWARMFPSLRHTDRLVDLRTPEAGP